MVGEHVSRVLCKMIFGVKSFVLRQFVIVVVGESLFRVITVQLYYALFIVLALNKLLYF